MIDTPVETFGSETPIAPLQTSCKLERASTRIPNVSAASFAMVRKSESCKGGQYILIWFYFVQIVQNLLNQK